MEVVEEDGAGGGWVEGSWLLPDLSCVPPLPLVLEPAGERPFLCCWPLVWSRGAWQGSAAQGGEGQGKAEQRRAVRGRVGQGRAEEVG